MIEMTRRKKTIVTGRNVSFAILNQMNENAQKSIARRTPPYILILFFTGWLLIYRACEFNKNIEKPVFICICRLTRVMKSNIQDNIQ